MPTDRIYSHFSKTLFQYRNPLLALLAISWILVASFGVVGSRFYLKNDLFAYVFLGSSFLGAWLFLLYDISMYSSSEVKEKGLLGWFHRLNQGGKVLLTNFYLAVAVFSSCIILFMIGGVARS